MSLRGQGCHGRCPRARPRLSRPGWAPSPWQIWVGETWGALPVAAHLAPATLRQQSLGRPYRFLESLLLLKLLLPLGGCWMLCVLFQVWLENFMLSGAVLLPLSDSSA